MARRSSARLRDRTSDTSTPKRVSLSHDAPITRTPRTLPSKLAALQESDEMPGVFPHSASPKLTFPLYPVIPSEPGDNAAAAAAPAAVVTPTRLTPMKPPSKEMHPQMHHQSTAKPRDEARHLGFSNMAPHTEPPKHMSKIAVTQNTPTKARDLQADVKSPSYQFTFHREHSLELSPAAKKLMQEKREEAIRIREQMVADGEGLHSIDQVLAERKMAKPKGRFSQAHTREFEKMDSIAAHASAFRLKAAGGTSTPSKIGTPKPKTPKKEEPLATKSLKRSPSKAGLDAPATPSGHGAHVVLKPLPALPNGSHLPHPASIKDSKKTAPSAISSPSKRVKRTESDDVSANRPGSSHDDKPLPSTPQISRDAQGRQKASSAALSNPTQASLARTGSVKSTKSSKIPGPLPTPAKASATLNQKNNTHVAEASKGSSVLLDHAPLKQSASVKPQSDKPVPMISSIFARTPAKAGIVKRTADVEGEESIAKVKTPRLFARSPLKASTSNAGESNSVQEKAPSVPLLARSPTKLPVANKEAAETPSPNKLLGRFNLLRQSPMKSILRSPQRLYSDDPTKVAAGTHLATPPKHGASKDKALPVVAPATAPVHKRVDFSSSTKAREKAQGWTPTKTLTPSPQQKRAVSVQAEPVSYPDLSPERMLSPSPQKRRQTSGPLDFTFRAGDQDIVFGKPADIPASAAQGKRPSTIRVVSRDHVTTPPVATGSKKRKFEFESHAAVAAEVVTDKENAPMQEKAEDDTQAQRPAKRVKSSAPSSIPVEKAPAVTATTAPTKRTTLGVKPKGAKNPSPVKRTGAISQARLNALSQPKRRS